MFLSIKSNATKILAAILALTLAASPSISCISANETNNVESKVPAVSGVVESKNEGFYKKHPILSNGLIWDFVASVSCMVSILSYEKHMRDMTAQIDKLSDEQKRLLAEEATEISKISTIRKRYDGQERRLESEISKLSDAQSQRLESVVRKLSDEQKRRLESEISKLSDEQKRILESEIRSCRISQEERNLFLDRDISSIVEIMSDMVFDSSVDVKLKSEIKKFQNRAPGVFVIDANTRKTEHRKLLCIMKELNRLFDKYEGFTDKVKALGRDNKIQFCIDFSKGFGPGKPIDTSKGGTLDFTGLCLKNVPISKYGYSEVPGAPVRFANEMLWLVDYEFGNIMERLHLFIENSGKPEAEQITADSVKESIHATAILENEKREMDPWEFFAKGFAEHEYCSCGKRHGYPITWWSDFRRYIEEVFPKLEPHNQ